MTDLAEARALAEAARADTSEGLTAREKLARVVEELCDAVEKLTPPSGNQEARALLLTEIRDVGGEWTGSRVERFWWQRFQARISPERGVQHLLLLEGAGHVVRIRPRARTFVLTAGPQDPPRVEWATRMLWPSDGSEEIGHPVGESLARSRVNDYPKLNVALLRRTVTFGPWVEVPVDAEAGDE